MKYRDHKGGLSESMLTEIEVNSIDEIKQHLNKRQNPFGLHVEEIMFKYIGFDWRTGWISYYVLQRIKGKEEFTVTGISDGCF